jgi:hypothetical protein
MSYDDIDHSKQSWRGERRRREKKTKKNKQPYRCNCEYCVNGKCFCDTKRRATAEHEMDEFHYE